MFSVSVKNSVIRRFLEILLHFIFPVSCPVCGKPGVKICPECRNSQLDTNFSVPEENNSEDITITANAPAEKTSDIPARILPQLFTGEIITRNINGLTVYSAAKYREGPIKEILYRLKYEGMRELGRPLGRYMAEFFGQCKADILIPVPLHLFSTRGYNQSKELAEGMCDFWGVKILDAALWTREVPRRAATNLRGDITYEDFRLTKDIYGKRIALVDDVCTTGNTLYCLTETCYREGAVVVCAYTLANV